MYIGSMILLTNRATRSFAYIESCKPMLSIPTPVIGSPYDSLTRRINVGGKNSRITAENEVCLIRALRCCIRLMAGEFYVIQPRVANQVARNLIASIGSLIA